MKMKWGQEKETFASVLAYNWRMIGVDLNDELLHPPPWKKNKNIKNSNGI
jgi:hypothetical protein